MASHGWRSRVDHAGHGVEKSQTRLSNFTFTPATYRWTGFYSQAEGHYAILYYDGNNKSNKKRVKETVPTRSQNWLLLRPPSQGPVPWPAFPCKHPWITFVTMTQAHVSMTLHITSSVFLHQQICRCLAQALSQKDAGSTCGSHSSIRPRVSDNLSKAPFPHRKSGSHNNADLTGFLQNSEIYI